MAAAKRTTAKRSTGPQARDTPANKVHPDLAKLRRAALAGQLLKAQQRIGELTKERAAAAAELATAHQDVERLTIESRERWRRAAEAEAKHEEAERFIATLTRQSAGLSSSLETTRAQLHESEKRHAEERQANLKLRLDVDAMESEIATLRLDVDTLESEIATLGAANRALGETVSRTMSERMEAAARLQQETQANAELRADLRANGESLSTALSNIRDLQRRIEGRELHIESLNDRIVDLAGDERYFRARAERLELALTGMAMRLGSAERAAGARLDEDEREKARNRASPPEIGDA